MAEPTKKQTGEGSDNYGQAAKQMAKAAKQIGKDTAKQAAKKGAEATGRAAAATVKASVKAGKAAAEIAAGTAAGGPWGAIISAAWSLRHTLFKILICICLVIAFLAVVIVSLPSLIFQSLFDWSGDPTTENPLVAVYADLSEGIYSTLDSGYSFALDEVDRIIVEGGYDYELSIASLDDQAADTREYDVCYIIAAYSASEQQNSSSNKRQMLDKLDKAKADMFLVTFEERIKERPKEQDQTKTETVKYAACIIHKFSEGIILTAFGINANAQYAMYSMTYGEYIEYMSFALRMTLFGTTEK